jgi:hypothetical protein
MIKNTIQYNGLTAPVDQAALRDFARQYDTTTREIIIGVLMIGGGVVVAGGMIVAIGSAIAHGESGLFIGLVLFCMGCAMLVSGYMRRRSQVFPAGLLAPIKNVFPALFDALLEGSFV